MVKKKHSKGKSYITLVKTHPSMYAWNVSMCMCTCLACKHVHVCILGM